MRRFQVDIENKQYRFVSSAVCKSKIILFFFGFNLSSSGAECAAVVRDACLLALRQVARTVFDSHFVDRKFCSHTRLSLVCSLMLQQSIECTVLSLAHIEAAVRATRRQITPAMLAFYANFERQRGDTSRGGN